MKKMQKSGKSLKKTENDINYKKLFFELMIVLSVAFVATIAILHPFLQEKLEKRDKYESFRPILEEVDNYDYSKGRDKELEARLDKNTVDTFSDTATYFYALARGTYYCKVGYYNTAIESFNYVELNQLPEEEEQLDYEARKVICQRKIQKDDEAE